jgi:biotin-dependent carboxylase-like uncharacterized protein
VHAAALETTLAGPKLRADGDVVIALAGARVSARIGAAEIPMDKPVALPSGEVLSVGMARTGLRTYIAFAGGIETELTLGSAATDLLTGLGPAPLARGDLLELGAVGAARVGAAADWAGDLVASGGEVHSGGSVGSVGPAASAEGPLRVMLGPRQDRFTDAALSRLTGDAYTVNPASNRVGLRLDGPPLERSGEEELRSEGMVAGALQVPPDGQPILLLVDHPTTGGYPVIAVLADADLARAGQLRPGEAVRFTVVS